MFPLDVLVVSYPLKCTEQKPEEEKTEPAKPKEKTPPKQKAAEDEKSKAEQSVKTDKSGKPTAPPQIIEPVEEPPADKNAGKGNPKTRNPKTNKKDNPDNPKDSEEDTSKPHKTKMKPYQKKPTTILEEGKVDECGLWFLTVLFQSICF